MNNPLPFAKLRAQADPEHKGKHPLHDHRYITTDHQLVYEPAFSSLSRGVVEFADGTPDAAIIATMTDHKLQAAYATLFAASPSLLEASKRFADRMAQMMNDYELPEECNGIICGELDAMNDIIAKATMRPLNP